MLGSLSCADHFCGAWYLEHIGADQVAHSTGTFEVWARIQVFQGRFQGMGRSVVLRLLFEGRSFCHGALCHLHRSQVWLVRPTFRLCVLV